LSSKFRIIFWYGTRDLAACDLKKSTLRLLSDNVTFTPSSFNTSFCGGGKKSSTTLIRPSGSSVYLGLRFINHPTAAPIAGTYDSNLGMTVRKPYCHYPVCNFTEAIPPFLGLAVANVLGDDACVIQEGELRLGEANAMLSSIGAVFCRIPLEAGFHGK
jgi:hypothetical protein